MLETLPTSTDFIPPVGTVPTLVHRLRALAVPALTSMYQAEDRTFVFRVKLTPDGIVPEGVSRRYTAITLIGLAQEAENVVASILGNMDPRALCDHLVRD